MTTGGRVEDLIRQFQGLPESKKGEYSIMVGGMEYGPQEIANFVRDLESDSGNIV
jgi:hypothetical protein